VTRLSFFTQLLPLCFINCNTLFLNWSAASHRFCSFTSKHRPFILLLLLLSLILFWKTEHNTTGSTVLKGSWLVTILDLQFSQQLFFFLLNGTNVQMCKWLFQFHQWWLLQVHLSVFLLSHVLIQFFFWVKFLLLRWTWKCKSWLSLLDITGWAQVKIATTTMPMLLKINLLSFAVIAVGFSLCDLYLLLELVPAPFDDWFLWRISFAQVAFTLTLLFFFHIHWLKDWNYLLWSSLWNWNRSRNFKFSWDCLLWSITNNFLESLHRGKFGVDSCSWFSLLKQFKCLLKCE